MNILEKIFGRTAQSMVLECMLKNPKETTYLSGIAAETGLSHSSVARVITPLLEQGIVTESRLGKQIRTFKLNQENEITRLIMGFYTDLSKLPEE